MVEESIYKSALEQMKFPDNSKKRKLETFTKFVLSSMTNKDALKKTELGFAVTGSHFGAPLRYCSAA